MSSAGVKRIVAPLPSHRKNGCVLRFRRPRFVESRFVLWRLPESPHEDPLESVGDRAEDEDSDDDRQEKAGAFTDDDFRIS